MNDELIDKLTEYADKIESVVVDNAPEAYDLLLKVVQVEAAQNLLVGFLSVIATYVFYRLARWGFREGNWIPDPPRPRYLLSAIVGVGGGVGTFIGALICLFDVWNWAAFFYPEIAVAHEILQRMGM